MIRKSLSFLLLAAALGACAKQEPPKPPLVQTVAILPFDSESNNVNAPDILQKLTYEALRRTGYQVSDLETVNQKLADAGIVDGGQLPTVDPVKLGKDLGVQGLLYGNVESFGYANLGFYSQRKVRLELKLVEVATGQTLWENTGSGVTRDIALNKDQASQNLAKGLLQQTVDKVMKNPLEEESRLATLQALKTLPGFSFHGFSEENGAARGAQRAIKGLIR